MFAGWPARLFLLTTPTPGDTGRPCATNFSVSSDHVRGVPGDQFRPAGPPCQPSRHAALATHLPSAGGRGRGRPDNKLWGRGQAPVSLRIPLLGDQARVPRPVRGQWERGLSLLQNFEPSTTPRHHHLGRSNAAVRPALVCAREANRAAGTLQLDAPRWARRSGAGPALSLGPSLVTGWVTVVQPAALTAPFARTVAVRFDGNFHQRPTTASSGWSQRMTGEASGWQPSPTDTVTGTAVR